MENQRKKQLIGILLAMLTIAGAVAAHYLFDPWGFYRRLPEQEAQLRLQVVKTAQSWLGTNEADGSHRAVLEIYNGHEPLAVDYVVKDTDSWCATFVSTVAIQEGLTDIIPTECGCERQIGLFQTLGRWQESDDHIPAPGDLIYYDWDETQRRDCTGWSDHVGLVVGVKWPFVKVIEGNCNDQVMERVIMLGDITIRGYGLPDYAGSVQ